MKRLYLEYQPVTDSLEQIKSLQATAIKENYNAAPIEIAQLHLTLLHFGVTEQVYKELRVVVPELSWQRYMKQVNRFAASVQVVLPHNITALPQRYALYGHGASVLVIELQVDAAAHQAQQKSLELLTNCLAACGVAEPLAYMQTNHNFKHALDFKPHMSLARNVQTIPSEPIVQEKLHLELVPLGYDLRHERFT